MVRAETCSEVDGSNKMTLPCTFPAEGKPCILTISSCYTLTEGDVSVFHPSRNAYLFVSSKSSDLITSSYIPYNGSVPGIIAHRQPSSTSFTDNVRRYPTHVFSVAIKTSFYSQSIVAQAQDKISLGVEEMRGSCSAWLQLPLCILGSQGGLRRNWSCVSMVPRARRPRLVAQRPSRRHFRCALRGCIGQFTPYK